MEKNRDDLQQAHQNQSVQYLKTLLKGAGAAAFSACVAEILTIPFDTVKVRL